MTFERRTDLEREKKKFFCFEQFLESSEFWDIFKIERCTFFIENLQKFIEKWKFWKTFWVEDFEIFWRLQVSIFFLEFGKWRLWKILWKWKISKSLVKIGNFRTFWEMENFETFFKLQVSEFLFVWKLIIKN